MKSPKAVKTSGLILAFGLMNASAFSQTDAEKAADAWVKSKVWAKGLSVDIYTDVNNKEFKRQYEASREAWDKTFQFLADHKKLESLSPGTYTVDGTNVYASITEAPSKAPDLAKWESHRKYVDLQYVIRGKEKIEVAPLASATVTEPYNESKDVIKYTANGKYYMATPESFFLFFPSDVHRPSLKAEGNDVVKKLVIKIKYVE